MKLPFEFRQKRFSTGDNCSQKYACGGYRRHYARPDIVRIRKKHNKYGQDSQNRQNKQAEQIVFRRSDIDKQIYRYRDCGYQDYSGQSKFINPQVHIQNLLNEYKNCV